MDHDVPTLTLHNHWADVEADLEATAAELAAEGWTTVTLHTGDATSLVEGEPGTGLDVMVPGNEFAALEAELEAGAAFSESAVFRQAAGGVAFLVFVLKDPKREVAALFPAFYPQQGRSAQALAEQAREAGRLKVFVRPLDRSRVVTFTIEDPSLVFPENWSEIAEE